MKGNGMIGIITLFYKNYNIGGLLQAYALQNYLSISGIECEQICVWHYEPQLYSIHQKIKRKLNRFAIHPVNEIKNTLYNKDIERRRARILSHILKREELMDEFVSIVPHSKKIYTADNIDKTLKIYSGFIVGSDQIWNDEYISEKYMRINFLEFVPDSYFKMAYAASIGKEKGFESWFKNNLKKLESFDGVSVREKTAQSLLMNLSGICSEVVSDPVLLLSKTQWSQLIKGKNINDKKYIFTYFLGTQQESRDFVNRINKNLGLEIINFAHAINFYCKADDNFGDKPITEFSPTDFIQVISECEMVVTDSFHATLFAIIFEKPFYTLARNNGKNMSPVTSRITDLLDYYGLQNHFIDTTKFNNFNGVPSINYKKVNKKVILQKEYSKIFINKSIKKYKNKII